MNRIHVFFMDFFNVLKTRLKFIFTDKVTVTMFLIAVLLSFVVSSVLNDASASRSKVPIGLVDEDNSLMSQQLVENISNNKALFVYIGDFNTLKEKVKDQSIEAIFVINKGLETRIKSGEVKDLITLYYAQNDKSNTVLADILAGELMPDICSYRAYHIYKDLEFAHKQITDEDYIKRLEKYFESDEYKFVFDLEIVDTVESSNLTKTMDNSLIYKQIIMSILSMMIAFVSMFACSTIVLEKESLVYKRKKITLLSRTADFLGDYMTILILSLVLSCWYYVVMVRSLGNIDVNSYLRLASVFALFTFVTSMGLFIISKCLKSVIKYQVVCSALIIVLSVIGFVGMILNKFDFQILKILKVLPNCWFIKEFTDIIVNITSR